MTAVNTGTEVTDALGAEAQAFRRKLPQLLVRYEGEFVALYRGRVVGHEASDEELAERMYERLGDVPFYIARVERRPTVYDLPSPEVVG
jgi:predicted phage tail protein